MVYKTEISNTAHNNSSETSFLQAFDFFPISLFIIDKHSVILNANKLGFDLIGCEGSDAIGKNFAVFLDEHYKEQFKLLFKNILTNTQTQTSELLIMKPDGSKIYVLGMFRFFIHEITNEELCSIAMIDFTPQKMKEELIKQSEIRFKNLANTAPVMIWISDAEGLFSFVNNIWVEYSGGNAGEQLGMNWLRNVHPEDLENLVSNYQNMISSRSAFNFEFRLKNRDGKFEWMLFKGTPRFSMEKIFLGFIGSCFSINNLKEIEEKVSKMNSELVEMNAAKDKLFSIISHDLRSPLSGLIGILDILNTSYESIQENERREIISNAAVVSKTTYTLMENLLEWSRIQTGKIKCIPENLNLIYLVNNVVSLYINNLKNKSLTLKIDIRPDLYIYADKTMTETILRNLISNAIKFSYQKSAIKISSVAKDDSIIIKVKDTGVGIDEEKSTELFNIGSGYSTRGTANESGAGLGLVICKELVDVQGGKMWVESKKDKGSVFYFSVPIVK